jgi:threonine dehydrogenase-like Zn-dependent dehydrogenase
VYANVPKGGSIAVYGLGPIGQLCTRIARHLGAERVFGVDLVPERLETARRHGIEVVDLTSVDDVPGYVRDATDGRGPDGVIDAVGMESHGDPIQKLGQQMATTLPDAIGGPMAEKFGIDRLGALTDAIDTVRRGGTVSIIGVYGGAVDPMPMLQMFDKGIQLRMGQCHVKRWIDDIMPLLVDDTDPLDTEGLATHHLPLDQAPHGYEIFQKKQDGCQKVVLRP